MLKQADCSPPPDHPAPNPLDDPVQSASRFQSTPSSPTEPSNDANVSGGIFTTSLPTQRAPHAHDRAQLLLPLSSALVLEVGGLIRVIPPSAAVWIPPQMPHCLHHGDGENVACLYFEPAVVSFPADGCRILLVPALLRQLILQVSDPTALRCANEASPGGHLRLVLLEQLVVCHDARLVLPMPADRRLQRLLHSYIATPLIPRSSEQWAHQFGMSDRNLARLFRQQTGMSFGQWARALQVMTSLQQLMAGRPVYEVADFFGYSHPSTFISMFKKVLGESPGRFMQHHGVAQTTLASLEMHGRP